MTGSGAQQIDYAAALAEAGFDRDAVERGVQMWATGRYVGFADLVASMRFAGMRAGVRDHHLDEIARRVSAQEAAAAIIRRGERAAVRVAVRQAEEAAEREAVERRQRLLLEESSRLLDYLFANATEAELNDEVGHRPQIAAAFRRLQDVHEQQKALREGKPLADLRGTSFSGPQLTDEELTRRAVEAFDGGSLGAGAEDVDEAIDRTFGGSPRAVTGD